MKETWVAVLERHWKEYTDRQKLDQKRQAIKRARRKPMRRWKKKKLTNR